VTSLVQPEIGGGKLDAEQLGVLDSVPAAPALHVSGLDQTAFERLVADYGHRYTAIHFWKCPRVEDLSPLEDLPFLELVAFYWNQRATRLWDFRRTPRLRGLSFKDFRKLTALDELVSATSLDQLVFGDAVESKSVFDSLDPLGGLARLRSLEFMPRRIADGRVDALGGLDKLEHLYCPSNLFTSRQFAWLRARLPRASESRVLQPLVNLPRPLGEKDVLLVGRGKPFLNSGTDAVRISKHVDQFNRYVAEYVADPQLLPS